MYKNKEAVKGTVKAAIPEDSRELSRDHRPLGCLIEEVKVGGSLSILPLKLIAHTHDLHTENTLKWSMLVLGHVQCKHILQQTVHGFR